MEQLRSDLYEVVKADAPMTVRQVFYRAVSASIINKSESEYKTTVVRLLSEMRRAGELPFDWIADATRWMRKPRTHDDLSDLLENTARLYRRSLWTQQNAYVEVWLEKDALAGVIYRETGKWDVPLMVTRGYPSLSFLHSAGEQIGEIDKPTWIYYLGDHDPSGVDIPRKVEAGIREYAGDDLELHFERLAVTPEQINELSLPTRPTKASDSRSKSFEGQSVEVDAIEPTKLREMVREAIEQHVDQRALEVVQEAERDEKDFLRRLAETVEDEGTEGVVL